MAPTQAPLSVVHNVQRSTEQTANLARSSAPMTVVSRKAAPSVQPKVTVGPANDQYEQEADRVADQVMSMPPSKTAVGVGGDHGATNVQRTPLAATITPLTPAAADTVAKHGDPTANSGRDPAAAIQMLREEYLPHGNKGSPHGDFSEQTSSGKTADPGGGHVQTSLGGSWVQRGSSYRSAGCDACGEDRTASGNSMVQTYAIQRACAACSGEQQDAVQRSCSACAAREPPVQRACACGGDHDAEATGSAVQPKPGGIVMRNSDGGGEASSSFESSLEASKGGGEPMSSDTQSDMEGRFGADFSDVRVHTGNESAQMNQDIGARAFTHGSDIYFNSGEYQPESSGGKHLLAHELTHTVQQGGASVQAQRSVSARAPPMIQPELDTVQREEEMSEEELQEQLESATEDRVAAIDPGPAEQAKSAAEVPNPDETEVVVEPTMEEGQALDAESREASEKAAEGAESESGGADQASAEGGAAAAEKPDSDAGPIGKEMEAATANACAEAEAKTTELAANEKTHETPEQKQANTDAAQVPPAEEGQQLSNAEQVESIEKEPEPTPDEAGVEAAKSQAIAESIPSDIDEINEFKSEGKAKVAGEDVKKAVNKDVDATKATYNEIEKQPPAKQPEKPSVALPERELKPETPEMALGKDAIKELDDKQVDMSHFDKGSDDALESEGITEENLAMVDEGDLAEAHKERGTLKKKVEEEPAAIQEDAKKEKQKVEDDLAQEEKDGRKALDEKRNGALTDTEKEQEKTKTALEKKREKVASDIKEIYTKAETDVKQKLTDLEEYNNDHFDKMQVKYSNQFEKEVNNDVEDWKDERYSGLFGGVKWLKDKIFGIAHFTEVNNFFARAKERYVERIDELIADITKRNKKVIEECKKILSDARVKIKEYVDNLGPELKDAGQKSQEEMKKKLDDMDKFVDEKKAELATKLCAKRKDAIKKIDEKIESMKEDMGGLLDKLVGLLLDAMLKFFKWGLKKLGLDGGQLMGILEKGASVIKKIVGDPIAFIMNLFKAVKQGVNLFGTNIKTHLLNGLISWLTGAMGDIDIQLPETFDAKGFMSLGLQVLGLTWERMREKLAKRIGEEKVAMLETGFDVVQRVIKDGPIALWDILKEKADEFKTTVIEGIRDWIATELVKIAIGKLITMVAGPWGAILEAILTIYNLIMFFVENWDRIVGMVTAVFDFIGPIAFGDVGAAAAGIESAMALAVPILLSFLARLIRLNGIGKAVQKIIKKIRKPIDKAIDKALDWITKKAKSLFKGKGKGAKDDKMKVKKESDLSADDRKQNKKVINKIVTALNKPSKKKVDSYDEIFDEKKKEAKELDKKHKKEIRKGLNIIFDFPKPKGKEKYEKASENKHKIKVSIKPNDNDGDANVGASNDQAGSIVKKEEGFWKKMFKKKPTAAGVYNAAKKAKESTGRFALELGAQAKNAGLFAFNWSVQLVGQVATVKGQIYHRHALGATKETSNNTTGGKTEKKRPFTSVQEAHNPKKEKMSIGTFSSTADSGLPTLAGAIANHFKGTGGEALAKEDFLPVQLSPVFGRANMPATAHRPVKAKAKINGYPDKFDRDTSGGVTTIVGWMGNYESMIRKGADLTKAENKYEGGHLIGSQFGGPDSYNNMAPQSKPVNQVAFKQFGEQFISDRLDEFEKLKASPKKTKMEFEVTASYGSKNFTLPFASALAKPIDPKKLKQAQGYQDELERRIYLCHPELRSKTTAPATDLAEPVKKQQAANAANALSSREGNQTKLDNLDPVKLNARLDEAVTYHEKGHCFPGVGKNSINAYKGRVTTARNALATVDTATLQSLEKIRGELVGYWTSKIKCNHKVLAGKGPSWFASPLSKKSFSEKKKRERFKDIFTRYSDNAEAAITAAEPYNKIIKELFKDFKLLRPGTSSGEMTNDPLAKARRTIRDLADWKAKQEKEGNLTPGQTPAYDTARGKDGKAAASALDPEKIEKARAKLKGNIEAAELRALGFLEGCEAIAKLEEMARQAGDLATANVTVPARIPNKFTMDIEFDSVADHAATAPAGTTGQTAEANVGAIKKRDPKFGKQIKGLNDLINQNDFLFTLDGVDVSSPAPAATGGTNTPASSGPSGGPVTGTGSKPGEKIKRKASLSVSQAKLQRSTAAWRSDPHEQEADRMADHVTSGGGELGTQSVAPAITRVSTSGPATALQGDNGATEGGGSLDSGIASSKGGGSSLDGGTRERMESGIGADFGGVKVHTDSHAAEMSQSIGARAFTHGNDIYFNEGQYNPGSKEGDHLIAHELTHTVQQGAAPVQAKRQDASRAPPISRGPPGVAQRGLLSSIGNGLRSVGSAIASGARAVGSAVADGFQSVLRWIASGVHNIPGYTMMTVLIGRDPVLDSPVERSPLNFLRGFLGMSLGGELLFQKMNENGALNEASAWISTRVNALGISWSYISGLFSRARSEMGVTLGVAGNMNVIRRIFGPPLQRILAFVSEVASKVLEFIKNAVLIPMARIAHGRPGYTLLTVMMGRDPVTDEPVERNATNIIGGFMQLIGQEERWQQIQQSQVIGPTFTWFEERIAGLNITWPRISGMFNQAWESLSIDDILTPLSAMERMWGIFGGFVTEIFTFAREAAVKVLEFIFEGFMIASGPFGQRILTTLKRTRRVFEIIWNDPMAFAQNLLAAVRQGMTQFAENILAHLRDALLGWLFGSVADSITMPDNWDLAGLLDLGLQILGLTYQNLRQKLVERTSEETVQRLETAFEFIRILVTEGLAAAWEKILEFGVDIISGMIEGVTNMVVQSIVEIGVQRLALLAAGPYGAIVEAVMTTYRFIKTLMENIERIMTFVTGVLDAIEPIAMGDLDNAAAFVEASMQRGLTMLITFLAGLVGLGNIPDRIRDVIETIRAPIDRALTAVVDWVVTQIENLFGRNQEEDNEADLNVRTSFQDGDGEGHELFFREQGNGFDIMMASDNPRDLKARLDEKIGADGSTAVEIAACNEAKTMYDTLDSFTTANKAVLEDPENSQRESKMAEAQTQLNALAAKVVEGGVDLEGSLPETVVRPGAGSGNFAGSMIADPLTSVGEPGSEPQASATNEHWEYLRKRMQGGRTWYARGHLLNHNIHGPGTLDNLAPITQNANGRHLRQVETPIKTAVDAGKVVKYEVRANGTPGVRTDLKDQVERSNSPSEIKTLKLNVINSEAHVPLSFDCRWTIYANAIAYEQGVVEEGPLSVSIDTYERSRTPDASHLRVRGEDGSAPAPEPITDVNINSGTREQLLALPGVGPVTADAILANRPFTDASQMATTLGGLEGRSINLDASAVTGGPINVQFKLQPQAKVKVGPANDAYEQEADRVADQVVSSPKGEGVQRKPLVEGISSVTGSLQRSSYKSKGCDACQEETRAGPVQAKFVQRNEAAGGKSGGETSASFGSQLAASSGAGRVMDDSTRGSMEQSFGSDFSDVRIHEGAEATAMNDSIGARAFTYGDDIYFNEGQYDPGSKEGQHLLAHELTHTVQQKSMVQRKVQRKPLEPAVAIERINRLQKDAETTIQLGFTDWLAAQKGKPSEDQVLAARARLQQEEYAFWNGILKEQLKGSEVDYKQFMQLYHQQIAERDLTIAEQLEKIKSPGLVVLPKLVTLVSNMKGMIARKEKALEKLIAAIPDKAKGASEMKAYYQAQISLLQAGRELITAGHVMRYYSLNGGATATSRFLSLISSSPTLWQYRKSEPLSMLQSSAGHFRRMARSPEAFITRKVNGVLERAAEKAKAPRLDTDFWSKVLAAKSSEKKKEESDQKKAEERKGELEKLIDKPKETPGKKDGKKEEKKDGKKGDAKKNSGGKVLALTPEQYEQFKRFLQIKKSKGKPTGTLEEAIKEFKSLSELELRILEANTLFNENKDKGKGDSGKPILDMGDVKKDVKDKILDEKALEQMDQAQQVLDAAGGAMSEKGRKALQKIKRSVGWLRVEISMLQGMMTGAGRRSPTIKPLAMALRAEMDKIVPAIKEKIAKIIAGGIVDKLLGPVGLAMKLLKAIAFAMQVVDAVRSVANIGEQLSNLTKNAERASGLANQANVVMHMLDNESADAEFEEKVMEIVIDKGLYRFMYVPGLENLPPEEQGKKVREILKDLPTGLFAFQRVFETYKKLKREKQVKDGDLAVLVTEAMIAGGKLYPVVGYSVTVLTAGVAAFVAMLKAPFNPFKKWFRRSGRGKGIRGKQKAKEKEIRGESRRAFAKQDSRRFKYEKKWVMPYLKRVKGEYRALYSKPEYSLGNHVYEPSLFRHVAKTHAKDINKEARAQANGRTVKARLKGKKGSKGRIVDAPAPAVRLSGLGGKKMEFGLKSRKTTAALSDLDFSMIKQLNYEGFKGTGLPYDAANIKGPYQGKKRGAVEKWLKSNGYQFTYEADPASGKTLKDEAHKHIRIKGRKGEAYLQLKAGFVKTGLDGDSWKKFIGKRIGKGLADQSKPLPEGYWAYPIKGGVAVRRKSGVSSSQLTTDSIGILTEGKAGKVPRVVDGAAVGISGAAPPASAETALVGSVDQRPVNREKMVDNMFTTDGTGAEIFDSKTYKPQGGKLKHPLTTREGWKKYLDRTPAASKRPQKFSAKLGYTVNRKRGSLAARYLPEMKHGDDKGHVVASRFNGPATDLGNLVPMKRALNQGGAWYKAEQAMAQVYLSQNYKSGDHVMATFSLGYDVNERRPSSLSISWYAMVGGKKVVGPGMSSGQ